LHELGRFGRGFAFVLGGFARVWFGGLLGRLGGLPHARAGRFGFGRGDLTIIILAYILGLSKTKNRKTRHFP